MESAKLNNPQTNPNSGCLRAVGIILTVAGGIFFTTSFFTFIFGFDGNLNNMVTALLMGAFSTGMGWILRKKFKTKLPTQISYEQRLLKLASESGGRLKVGIVALKLGMSLEDASKLLNHYANKGAAQAEVDEKGVITYIFPDFLP